MVSGGGGVDVPIVSTELLVHLQHGFIAAEVEQAIERVFDVLRIAGAGAQDVGWYCCAACR